MPTSTESRLNDALSSLIRDRPLEESGIRLTALATLTDLFLNAARHGSEPVPAHFEEIMIALLSRVPLEARAEASRRLAHIDTLPLSVVRLLADDVPEVAGPMLRQSPLVSLGQLAEIAAGPSDEKARAIAARADLPPLAISRLADRADPAIGAALAMSPGLRLDGREAGRVAMIPALPEAAAVRLLDVHDLPEESLAALFWCVGPEHRRHIVRRLAASAAAEDGAAAASDSVGAELLGHAAGRRRDLMAVLIARHLGLSERLAQAIIDDRQGEALVIAGRGLGISTDHITGTVLLTAEAAGTSYKALRQLVDFCEALDPAVARHLIALWRLNEARPEAARRARHEPAVAAPGSRHRTATQSPSRERSDAASGLPAWKNR